MKPTAQLNNFEYKCICDWSKDNKYGFIPNTKCPVHGKETKLVLSKAVPIKTTNTLNLDKKQKEWDKIPKNSVPKIKLNVKDSDDVA